MTEKTAMGDILSSVNALITQCQYAIEHSNNKNFRDLLIMHRNKLETLQWNTYLVSKDKGYYVPAAPAGEADVTEVKNSIQE